MNDIPCIPGTSIPVHKLFDALAAGQCLEALTRSYPDAPAGSLDSAIRKAGVLYAQHAWANDIDFIGPFLKKGLEAIDNVELALLFGSTARGEARPSSDIDVMIVGDVESSQVLKAFYYALIDVGRVVDAIPYTRDEWEAGRRQEGGLIHRVLQQPIVMLKGEL